MTKSHHPRAPEGAVLQLKHVRVRDLERRQPTTMAVTQRTRIISDETVRINSLSPNSKNRRTKKNNNKNMSSICRPIAVTFKVKKHIEIHYRCDIKVKKRIAVQR